MNRKRDILLFGTGRFSEMMSHYIESETSWKIHAFILNEKYIRDSCFLDRPVVSLETVRQHFSPQQYEFIIGAGYREMNLLRQKIFQQVKHLGYRIPNYISPGSHIGPHCTMGEGNIILENATIAFSTTLGCSNIIWNGCNISHESEIGDFNYFAPSSVLGGCTKITHNCFLGLNCTVKGSVTVKPFTLLGASCYLSHSTNENEVYVPARSYCLKNKNSLNMGL